MTPLICIALCVALLVGGCERREEEKKSNKENTEQMNKPKIYTHNKLGEYVEISPDTTEGTR